MCGITGIFTARDMANPDPIERMVGALRHRGPDGSGVVQISAGEATCWLGSTRLAIIDLSMAGHMPMSDPASGNWIVYNGEVYNFPLLRTLLLGLGDRLTSRTDTEVVLHLYRHFGNGVLDRLRGMFAFAVWDASHRVLLLARDRSGKKPLY